MMTNLQLLNNLEEDLNWFQENLKSLQAEYEDKIIAIKEKKIIASAKNIKELLKILEEKEIDQSEVLIETISSKNEIIIF